MARGRVGRSAASADNWKARPACAWLGARLNGRTLAQGEGVNQPRHYMCPDVRGFACCIWVRVLPRAVWYTLCSRRGRYGGPGAVGQGQGPPHRYGPCRACLAGCKGGRGGSWGQRLLADADVCYTASWRGGDVAVCAARASGYGHGPACNQSLSPCVVCVCVRASAYGMQCRAADCSLASPYLCSSSNGVLHEGWWRPPIAPSIALRCGFYGAWACNVLYCVHFPCVRFMLCVHSVCVIKRAVRACDASSAGRGTVSAACLAPDPRCPLATRHSSRLVMSEQHAVPGEGPTE